jgi:transcriptional regulator with XRE-family HTH domain
MPGEATSKKLHPQQAFARILTERRKALGLTQTDLAEPGLVDRSYISKLEKGEYQPCLDVILHLAEVLDMTPGQLMDAVAERLKKGS